MTEEQHEVMPRQLSRHSAGLARPCCPHLLSHTAVFGLQLPVGSRLSTAAFHYCSAVRENAAAGKTRLWGEILCSFTRGGMETSHTRELTVERSSDEEEEEEPQHRKNTTAAGWQWAVWTMTGCQVCPTNTSVLCGSTTVGPENEV